MKLPDKIYDKLKWIIVIVMPAAATLIIGYGEIFGWQYAEVIAKCIVLAQTFLGTVFAVSAVKYHADQANGITTIKPEDNSQEGE